MRKRFLIALAVLLVMLVGMSAWQVLCLRDREPVYQGKCLRVWLGEYDGWTPRGALKARNAAEAAIRQIGTNAFPTLLNMLRKEDSPLVSLLIPLWDQHVTRIPYLPVWVAYPPWYHHAAVLNRQASMGFEILRTNAHPALPALITIYEQNISPSSQFYVSRALMAIGPDATRKAIPSFVRGTASPNALVREIAVRALSQVQDEPSLVVPALVKALSDTNANVRSVAAVGLKGIGWSGGARQAVPALELLLSDPDGQVRRAAVDALKQIDPEAAAKAGVK
jgi:HEAT repeat protein